MNPDEIQFNVDPNIHNFNYQIKSEATKINLCSHNYQKHKIEKAKNKKKQNKSNQTQNGFCQKKKTRKKNCPHNRKRPKRLQKKEQDTKPRWIH